MAFDWYAFDPIKFRRDTYHLSEVAECIYRRLIDEYMITRLPLPDSDLSLAGIARVTPDVFNVHSATVRAFFKVKNGKLHQKKCDDELHAQSMLAAKRKHQAREAATVRWAKTKSTQSLQCSEHADSNADAMLNHATLHNKVISLTSTEYEDRGTSEKNGTQPLSEIVLALAKKSGVRA
jgi:uncharacterized protein YdaU (DUF1376 family)